LRALMPWRVIAHGDQLWHVDAVAERRANTEAWQLMLSFRAASTPVRPRAVWAPFPLEATSKSSLYIQAERIPDAALVRLLTERLA
jgi:hypothetical protein